MRGGGDRAAEGGASGGPEGPLRKGHRILAADGPKIALPKRLEERGCRAAEGAHYPQGMASVLYRLTGRIPAGFGLFSHGNGREAAIAHLGHASEDDVTVCGRGCLSFALALARRERGPRFVMRGGRKAGGAPAAFIGPDADGRTVTPGAPEDEAALRARKLRLRLVKHAAGDTVFRLAASLADTDRCGIQALSGRCHGRRGIGETYGTGKAVTGDPGAASARRSTPPSPPSPSPGGSPAAAAETSAMAPTETCRPRPPASGTACASSERGPGPCS